MKNFLLALLILCSMVVDVNAAILVRSPNGTQITTQPTLTDAATAPTAAGCTVIITSTLSAAQSNISGSWPSDRGLIVATGGSIGNTTTFQGQDNVVLDGGTFSGTGAVTGAIRVNGKYHAFTGSGPVTGLATARPEWFGATGTGQTHDDSSAFQAMVNASSTYLISKPPVYYVIASVTIPDKPVSFIGETLNPQYNPVVSDITGESSIVLKTGGTVLFNTTSGKVGMKNLMLYGSSGQTVPIFTAGAQIANIQFDTVGYYGFSQLSNQYIGVSSFINIRAALNSIGIANLIDSKVLGGYINANITGVSFGAGSNDNTVVGVKIEFNSGDNVSLFQSTHNIFSSCVIDRSGTYGIRAIISQAQFESCLIRRSYSSATTGSHILLGQSTDLKLSNIHSEHGKNDDGSGNDTPDSFITTISSPATAFIIAGSDVSGVITSTNPVQFGSYAPTAYTSKGNIGIHDTKDMFTTVLTNAGVGTVSSNTINAIAVSAFSRAVYRLKVFGRDSTNGNSYDAEFSVLIIREAGAATAQVTKIYSYGGVDVGTGTLQVAITSIATDASTFLVSLQNTGPDTLLSNVQLYY